ncbi:MAG: helix-turn-helix domain-containing protein [Clostridiales bacterium]|nr:helix-turn-helix domain-containing protein [Clostridiales bacterium]
MKLSMWMIANRLSSLDMELEISDNAPAILNSARRVYSTNCVHVYEEDSDAVCNGEGEIIRIHNMSSVQAFEIIQSVFDYFEDWSDLILGYIRQGNFQAVVDSCWRVFQNPLALFDANNKILGISSKYPADSLDSEWRHLYEYGYSSVHAVQQLRREFTNLDFEKHGTQPFEPRSHSLISYSGLSYCLYFNEIACGRLTLLSKDRPLNTGDYQLLEYLAIQLEPSLGQRFYKNELNTGNVFYNILMNRPYDDDELNLQLDYHQWTKMDVYNIALIRLSGEDDTNSYKYEMNILFHNVSQQYPDCVVIRDTPNILILSNHDLSRDSFFQSSLEKLADRNPVRIGFALPCRGLRQGGYLYRQALSALYYGELSAPDKTFCFFYDYAMDYMLDSHSIEENFHACLPAIVDLWSSSRDYGNELLQTLKCYLECSCSVSKTSAAIYTHRNTILYRLKKIQELLKDDLNDIYVRDYCGLSIRVLELYEKKSNSKTISDDYESFLKKEK